VAADQAARKNGHSVLVGHLAAGDADGATIVRTLIERRGDGIIAASAPRSRRTTEVAELLRRYVPSVSLQAVTRRRRPAVGVRTTGDRAAGSHPPARLGQHLNRHVTGTFRRRVTRSRLHGYEDALARRGPGAELSDLGAEGDWTPRGGAGRDPLLLERSPCSPRSSVHKRRDGDRRVERAVAGGTPGARGRSRW